VGVPARSAHWFRRFLAFVGPGYMVSVGYMDPGNWETDLQGGAQFGYTLLSVILISSLMAMLLQALSARLGIATGLDLVQACRTRYSRPVSLVLWLACEIAIIACDLAEVIGTAIALRMLFGIPLMGGTLISALDVVIVLALMNRGFRPLEAFVIALLSIIATCFAVQIVMAGPPLAAIGAGFVPHAAILSHPAMLYVAIGIIGATVMPHNLYLHSAIVQTRAYDRTPEGRRDALRWSVWDSSIALGLALFVNAAILIVAASAFHTAQYHAVAALEDAYRLLSPVLGFGLASTLFATALLAAGTNSTITGTLAGQIVMEGFVHLSLAPWARRLVTRGLAVVPTVAVIAISGDRSVNALLLFSQVVLSMQLPLAVIPLVRIVSDRATMGPFAIGRVTTVVAWAVAIVLVMLNAKLLFDALA